MFWWSSKAGGLRENWRGGRSRCLEATAIKFLVFAKVKSDGGKLDYFGREDGHFPAQCLCPWMCAGVGRKRKERTGSGHVVVLKELLEMNSRSSSKYPECLRVCVGGCLIRKLKTPD